MRDAPYGWAGRVRKWIHALIQSIFMNPGLFFTESPRCISVGAQSSLVNVYSPINKHRLLERLYFYGAYEQTADRARNWRLCAVRPLAFFANG